MFTNKVETTNHLATSASGQRSDVAVSVSVFQMKFEGVNFGQTGLTLKDFSAGVGVNRKFLNGAIEFKASASINNVKTNFPSAKEAAGYSNFLEYKKSKK